MNALLFLALLTPCYDELPPMPVAEPPHPVACDPLCPCNCATTGACACTEPRTIGVMGCKAGGSRAARVAARRGGHGGGGQAGAGSCGGGGSQGGYGYAPRMAYGYAPMAYGMQTGACGPQGCPPQMAYPPPTATYSGGGVSGGSVGSVEWRTRASDPTRRYLFVNGVQAGGWCPAEQCFRFCERQAGNGMTWGMRREAPPAWAPPL